MHARGFAPANPEVRPTPSGQGKAVHPTVQPGSPGAAHRRAPGPPRLGYFFNGDGLYGAWKFIPEFRNTVAY